MEEMNARVGYDVPLCFTTLNTIVINTERKMGEIPLIEKRTAMAVVCEVIANAHDGVVTLDAVADICQACIAYGWHWAREGESMLRSESVRKEIMDYLRDRADKMPLTEYTKRKEGLERGFAELAKVVEKYVRKGDKLYVEGRIRYRAYDDKRGARQYVTEILVENMEMLTTKPATPAQAPTPAATELTAVPDDNEVLPF